MSIVRMGTIGFVALAVTAVAAPVSAQELSDKSIHSFMEYAWSLVPQQYSKPDGTVIIVDKRKKDESMIPVDAAREVIRVGRLSAHAQVCELKADQLDNHQSLMSREAAKKTWTPQQMLYINQLHLTTVMLLTGKIKLVEHDGDKDVVVEEGKNTVPTCSEEQRAKVKELITAYVKTGPAIAANTVAPAADAGTGSLKPAAGPATPAAAPAPAEKK